MNSTQLSVSTLELFWLLGRGALLVLGLRVLSWAIDLLPLRSRTKELISTWGPLLAVALCVGYLFMAVHDLFRDHAVTLPLMLALVLVTGTVALWGPLRDVLAGVLLRAGQVVRLGDELQVGEIRGRAERLGYRRLLLRTPVGEALLPYSLVSKTAIVRAAGTSGAAAHSFRVRPIPGLSPSELRRVVSESALLCHWTSVAKAPQLTTAEQGALDVTVYALAPEYGPEIESAVRAQLARVEAREQQVERQRAAEGLARVKSVPPPREPAVESSSGT